MIFNSGLVLIIIPSLANAAETSFRLRGNSNNNNSKERQLQNNIDHLGGGGGSSNSNGGGGGDVDLAGVINGAINGNGGNMDSINDLIGSGGNLDNLIPSGSGPTIIGGGNGIPSNPNTPAIPNIPGIPGIDTSNIPGLPDNLQLPPNLGDIDLSNLPDNFDLSNLPDNIDLSNLPDNIDLSNLPDDIKDQIPDEVIDTLSNVTVPDVLVDTISDITGVQQPGSGTNSASDVCESLQHLTPEELEELFNTLNVTIPDNFTVPENFGENFTESYQNFGQNFSSTYMENFTAPENYTLPVEYNGNIPEGLQNNLPNGVPPNLQPGNGNPPVGQLPQDLSQYSFAQQLVLTGQFPCPVNGTFAPGTTLPPAVTDVIQDIIANRTLPPIVSQPDRCSGMSMANVTLLINAMPEINDGLECAKNYFESLGPKQTRSNLDRVLNGDYRGSMKFYHGSKQQFVLAKGRFAGMQCNLGSTCELTYHRPQALTAPVASVTFLRRCPTDDLFNQNPCLKVDYSGTRDGRTFYVRSINTGRFVTLAKPGRNANIQEFSTLVDKTVTNELIDQMSSSAQEQVANAQQQAAGASGATRNSSFGP